MKRRELIKQLGLGLPMLSGAMKWTSFSRSLGGNDEVGPFEPTWASLQKYQVPDWYSNAKFGIWAHWGPQCAPEAGDWYARGMYQEGSRQYLHHLEKYGHPSRVGFKDVIHQWRAPAWNPEELVGLYKRAGAKYFFAMANHHDNFDLYNSKYQPHWNSVKMGPQRDIIGGWAAAAKKFELPFGVTVHAAHAWRFFEDARRSDRSGRYAGIPYDGHLVREQGQGTWWKGLDPQDLYAQHHPLSTDSANDASIHRQWNWGNGVCPPTTAYMEKFVRRTIDLIDTYQPELLYFDDSQLPFWPISDAGLRIAAHHYNSNIRRLGKLTAVLHGKMLNEQQRKAMVWDIEKGQTTDIQPYVWQTDTCIGNWHYDRELYNRNGYKTAEMVIRSLVDVVSKNGNYLLNIPVRGDGSIDERERKIVEEIGDWMNTNGESIFGTRPWIQFGEGPSMQHQVGLTAQGFNEDKIKYTAEDIRFNVKANTIYATPMAWPADNKISITSLSSQGKWKRPISRVQLLGVEQGLPFEQTEKALVAQLPADTARSSLLPVLKVS